MTIDKIRVKGGPKVYKRGPRLRGRARLEQRLRTLVLDAHRFTTTASPADADWASTVVHELQVALGLAPKGSD